LYSYCYTLVTSSFLLDPYYHEYSSENRLILELSESGYRIELEVKCYIDNDLDFNYKILYLA